MKHQCHAQVRTGLIGRTRPCERPGSWQDPKGCWWCATHAPAGEADRQNRRQQNHRQWQARQAHARAQHEYASACVAFVERPAAGTIQSPLTVATALAKTRPKLSTDKA